MPSRPCLPASSQTPAVDDPGPLPLGVVRGHLPGHEGADEVAEGVVLGLVALAPHAAEPSPGQGAGHQGRVRGRRRGAVRSTAWQVGDVATAAESALAEEYDGDATTCRACQALPAAAGPRTSGAGEVTRRRTTPRAPAAAPGPASAPAPRRTLLGSTGSGDLEVRERRARRVALEALATSHPEEFGLLLRDARAHEGLRPQSAPAAGRPATSSRRDVAVGETGPVSDD